MSEIFYHRSRDGLDCKLGRHKMLEFFRSAVLNSKAKTFSREKAQEDAKGRREEGRLCHKRHKGHKKEKNKGLAILFSFCVFCAFFVAKTPFVPGLPFCVPLRLFAANPLWNE